MPTNAEFLKRRKMELEHKIKEKRKQMHEQRLVNEAVIDCLQDELHAIDKQIESRKGIQKKTKKKENE